MPTVPYEPDRQGRKLKDGRPLPNRPATPGDHHDHRHFPGVVGNCVICDDIAAREALDASPAPAPPPQAMGPDMNDPRGPAHPKERP